jgi:hypothetical protein
MLYLFYMNQNMKEIYIIADPRFRKHDASIKQQFTESHEHVYILFAFRTQGEPMKRDEYTGVL